MEHDYTLLVQTWQDGFVAWLMTLCAVPLSTFVSLALAARASHHWGQSGQWGRLSHQGVRFRPFQQVRLVVQANTDFGGRSTAI